MGGRTLALALFALLSLAALVVTRESGAAPPVVAAVGQMRAPLGASLEILEDADPAWSLDDVRRPEVARHFHPNADPALRLGIHGGHVWLHARARHDSPAAAPFLVEIGAARASVELWIAHEDGRVERVEMNHRRPFAERPVLHRNAVLPIVLHGAETADLWLRVTSTIASYPVVLWDGPAFAQADHDEQLLHGAFYGTCVVMLLYNLVLFLVVRDRAYLLYIAYVAAVIVASAAYLGLAFEYLWPGSPRWNQYADDVCVALVMLTLMALTRELAETRRLTPRHDRVLVALMPLPAAAALLALFLAGVRGGALMTPITLSLPFVCGGVAVASAIAAARAGSTLALFVIGGTGATLSGAGLTIGAQLGVLPDGWLTRFGFELGLVADAAIFSLALASRVDALRKALARSEARFRGLLEGAPLPIVELGGGHVQYANARFVEVFGSEPDALDLVAATELTAGGSPGRAAAETTLRRADGHTWPVELFAAAVGDRRIVLLNDLTLRYEAERGRAEERERADALGALLRGALDNASAGVLVVEGEAARVRLANPELRRTLAVPAATPDEELGPRTWRARRADGAEIRFDQLPIVRALLRGEPSRNQEIRLSTPEGERVVLMNAAPLPRGAGAEASAIAVLLDVTDRHRLADELQAAQRLEAVGRLASGIAHDFNNQLTVILSAAELVRMASKDATVRACADEMAKASKRASDLTRKLLSIAHRGDRRRVPVDLNALCEEVASIAERTFDRRIRVRSERAEPRAVVRGEETQLQSAALNLALNARDAMPDGGDLVLRVRPARSDEILRAQIDGEEPRSWVALEVEDTGAGIAPAQLARIFEPFFTTKERGKGTGLGLAAVQSAATEHGGAITVESTVGRGSRFALVLPCTTDLRPAAAPAPGPRASRAFRVLLVEDEEAVRAAVARALEGEGCVVHVAASAAEAATRVAAGPHDVDVVVLDVMRADASSKPALEALRGCAADLPLVIVSGGADDAMIAELTDSGPTRYVRKPFAAAELLAAIDAVARR